MNSLQNFVKENGIRLSCEWADRNPNMDDSDRMNNYKCRLTHKGRSMTLYFSMGLALTREPSVEDVLDCLASDSAGFENNDSFEDWCGEYGYDTDSRRAERTYKAIERQSEKLRKLLGEDLYQELLWETERL